ncbi:hypothetical protein [Bradyrhizobium sp. USDA 4451]
MDQPNPAPAVWHELVARLAHIDRRMVVAESMFVGGWALMWASSLKLIPFILPEIWLALIILGLLGAKPKRPK